MTIVSGFSRFWPCLLGCLFLLGLSEPALAVRKAKVNTPTPLLKKIDDKQDILRTLAPGTGLQTSDNMKDGYYKALTADGVLGYVYGAALTFEGRPATAIPTQPATAPPVAARRSAKPAPAPAAFRGLRTQLRAFGGAAFINAQELNTQFSQEFRSTLGGGLEATYAFTPTLAAVLRAEYLGAAGRGYVEETPGSRVDYEFALTAIPIAVGAELTLVSDPAFTVRASLLAGASPATQFKGTASTEPAPNETKISGTAFQGIAKTTLGLSLSPGMELFTEVGYRYLKTGALIPASGANGDEVFRALSGGGAAPYAPLPINLSGILASAGIAFRF